MDTQRQETLSSSPGEARAHLESWGARVVFLARLRTPGGLQAGLLRLRQLGDAVASESLGSNPVSVVLWLLRALAS